MLFTNAGNAPSNNLARSLRAGAEPVFIVGCNDDQFILKKSDADRNYRVPPANHPEWAKALRWIVEAEGLDLILPTIDSDPDSLSRVLVIASKIKSACRDSAARSKMSANRCSAFCQLERALPRAG